MEKSQIAQIRLANQQIVGTKFTKPDEIVSWLGAVQAQDYAMAKWALGVRLQSTTEKSIEMAIDNGSIVRTHVLRPTWHFVTAKDIRWMLDLTAARIRAACASRSRQLELDSKLLGKSNKIIGRALEGGKHLTRQELMVELERSGISTGMGRAIHLMLEAELDGIVCNGKRRGKQFTYSLLDETVPAGAKPGKDEALANLAERYFRSHGPATIRDFVWWSGLSVTEATNGLDSIKHSLISLAVDAQIYWMPDAVPFNKNGSRTVHFLPAFDEFMVSYKDRSASLEPDDQKIIITGHGIFKPIIVVNGQIKGVWKRTFKKDTVLVEPELFADAGRINTRLVERAARKYSLFEEKELRYI